MRGHRKLGALACALLLVVTGCGRTDKALVPDPVAPIVRVGYSAMAPDYVLAKLYVAVLQLKGVPARLDRIESRRAADGVRNVGPVVTQTSSIGHRAKLHAISTGLVDVVPEYTSQLLFAMNPDAPILRATVRRDTANPDTEFDPVFTEMTRSLPQETRSLQPSHAERTMVLAVRNKDPHTNGIRTYSQLADRCERFSILIHAYPADAPEMEHWADLVNHRYRCTPRSLVTEMTVTSGVDVVLTFAPDPLLLSEDWRLLTDDLHSVATAYIFPLVAKSAVDRPRQLIFDELSENLTTMDVAELLRVEYRTPDQLDQFISNWLRAKGLSGHEK